MTGALKLGLALGIVGALGVSHWRAFEAGKDIGGAACTVAESGRKDAVIEAVTGRVADNAVEQKQNEAKARKVSEDVQKELVVVRDFVPVYGVRLPALPGPRCDSAAGQAEAAGASGPDGAAAGTVVFPEEIQRAFDRFTEGAGRLQKEADGVTAVARGHQAFARTNGFYGEPEIPELDAAK